ncbi:MAG: hypothetical protein H6907_19355 [Hyphomicrobiales bacterium]|nr:hypothetical protein [Hyphomicrobiales bacterium]MCP5373895.1 hypothetical protein [Hyphomicrobiales bacterium]
MSSLSILVIGGHVYHRRLVVTVLQAMGAAGAFEADDPAGPQADGRVGLVICVDGPQPGDALPVVRRLRDGATGLRADVPLLLVGDCVDGEAGAEARRAGADGLVAKPVSAKVLYGALRALFADAA